MNNKTLTKLLCFSIVLQLIVLGFVAIKFNDISEAQVQLTNDIQDLEEWITPFDNTELYLNNKLTIESLDDLKELPISYDGDIVILFRMSGCSACEREEEFIRTLSINDLPFTLLFVDMSESSWLWSNQNEEVIFESELLEFKITATPTYLLYRNGSWERYIGSSNFRKILNSY